MAWWEWYYDGARDSGWRLGIRGSGFGTRDPGLGIRGSAIGLATRDSDGSRLGLDVRAAVARDRCQHDLLRICRSYCDSIAATVLQKVRNACDRDPELSGSGRLARRRWICAVQSLSSSTRAASRDRAIRLVSADAAGRRLDSGEHRGGSRERIPASATGITCVSRSARRRSSTRSSSSPVDWISADSHSD